MRIKVFGPPGTGKTTLLRRVVEHLTGLHDWNPHFKEIGLPELPFSQYSYYDIVFSTFTTSALEEFVVNRLGMSMDHDRRAGQPLRYFRTLHGIGFSLLIDSNIVDSGITQRLGGKSPLWYFKSFAKRYGLFFDTDAFGFSKLSKNITNNGNLVWMAMSKAINLYYPEEGKKAIERAYEWLPATLHEYIPLWEEYKEEKAILDFNDMLTRTFDALDAGEINFPIKVTKRGDEIEYGFKVIVVDEFQDFSPLQYELFKLLVKRAKPELVIIAGDDDQSIYAFQGASPKFLLEWEADYEVILKESKRVPDKIVPFSLQILDDVDDRMPKQFSGRGYIGAISKITYYTWDSLIDSLLKYIQKFAGKYPIMILTRTNKQALKIAEELVIRGINPKFLKTTLSWNTGVKGLGNFYTLIQVVHKLKRGKPLEPHERPIALFFSEFVNEWVDPEAFLESYNAQSLDTRLAEYQLAKDPLSHLDFERIAFYYHKIGAEVVKKILEVNAPEIKLPENTHLYLDTLHASKGREADLVFLINEMPIKPYGKVWARYFPDKESLDAERRLWYVGLTRARKGLFIFTNPVQAFPDLLKLIAGGSGGE